jgi:small subunit ribosomal protein S29
VPTFDICLSNGIARKTLDSTGLWNPFIEHDKVVQKVMRDVNVWSVEGINRPETRGIIDYYAKSGMLRATVTEALVNEQWAISGRGIIGEIERATLRMRG